MSIEIRDDADGTDGLIERVTVLLDREDVDLRGEEWRAERETPYALILRQWREHDHDEPTGPKIRVTFTVHVVEDIR